MEKIACILGEQAIAFSSIVLALAAVGAALLFLGFYLHRGGERSVGFAVVPLAVILSVVFARLLHWYCYAETYGSLLSALTDYSAGGFGLLGVFAGCLAAAGILRLLAGVGCFGKIVDCMALAGSAGLAVGRLASVFNSSDRGQLLKSVRIFPLAYPVTNAVSKAVEYRLATFALQALVAAALFVGLVLFSRRERRDGETGWLFALLYSASQIVLDSTRYDSLYFRWNGFVSIVQVVGALALVLTVVVFSRRLVLRRGLRGWYWAVWGAILALIGVAGYMEYHVQRHGSDALFAYSVMSVALAAVCILALWIRKMAEKKPPAGGKFLRRG